MLKDLLVVSLLLSPASHHQFDEEVVKELVFEFEFQRLYTDFVLLLALDFLKIQSSDHLGSELSVVVSGARPQEPQSHYLNEATEV